MFTQCCNKVSINQSIKSNLFESGSEAHIQVKEIKHRETQTHSNTKAHSKEQATIQ